MIWLLLLIGFVNCEDYLHSPIQYHSQTDRGTYNFGYDTGLYGAHQFHQENKDENGEVRGRYGYTDPEGNLRLVYYTAGVNGFRSWSPDEPSTSSSSSSYYTSSPYVYSHNSASSPYSSAHSSAQSPTQPNWQVSPKSSYLSPSQALRYEKLRATQTSSSVIPNPQRDDWITRTVSEALRNEAITSSSLKNVPTKSTQLRVETLRNEPIKSEKLRIEPIQSTPIKETKSYAPKTYYTPVNQYKSQYVSHSKSQIKASAKYSQTSNIKQANVAVPVVPAQYTTKYKTQSYQANYPPSGSYSRCWCE